ncbi:MAG: cell division protein PerM [Nocardioides sp.]
MTSLLPRSTTAATRPSRGAGTDGGHRRPLVLLATLGGVLAAAGPLVVCLAVGVVGWFLTDAGAHGTPRDGLRAGALGWLLAHGSGVHVQGVALTAVPLGATGLAAWAVWRVGQRVGDSVSGHGPDADRIADGERDWTVPLATLLFAVGYAVTAAVTLSLAGTPTTAPASGRVVLWSLVLALGLGGPAIAVGSGRAAIWASFLPTTLRASASTCRRVLSAYLLVALVAFVVSLALDFGSAANVLSQLHAGSGGATLFVLLMATVVPNAVAFSGSYLLGPGFTVGTHTIVSPALVVLGPMPMFPMLAALPDAGTSSWAVWLMVLPPLTAAVAAAATQRRLPTLRWDEGAVRGGAGGVAAGVLFAALAALSGGAVGPGRMQDVGPLVSDVLVHAVTAFGVGGLVGGLAMTAWQRRAARHAADR